MDPSFLHNPDRVAEGPFPEDGLALLKLLDAAGSGEFLNFLLWQGVKRRYGTYESINACSHAGFP